MPNPSDRDPFVVNPYNRHWWVRSPDDNPGDYPGPDDTNGGDEQAAGHNHPRNSSRHPSPPVDDTDTYCEGCGRPMETGGSAYCDACKARGRHRVAIQEDQLAEPPIDSHQGQSSDLPDQAPLDLQQPTILAEYHQAIAFGIDPAVLQDAGAIGKQQDETDIRQYCPRCEESTRHFIARYRTSLEEAAATPVGRLTDPYAKQRQRRQDTVVLQCASPGCTHRQQLTPRPPSQ